MINSGFGRTIGALTPLALALCATSSALAQGNSCAGATQVFNSSVNPGDTSAGVVYANTSLATTPCGNSSGNKAQWFKYVAAANGSVTFDTCATVATSIDTSMSIHTDCSNVVSNTQCNDDFCGSGGNSWKSSLTQTVVNGTTYYIRVSNYGTTTAGPYVLTVSALTAAPPPPPPGPDVTVFTMTDANRYTVGATTSFALGTTSFNAGSAPVDWRDGDFAPTDPRNTAPVIAQGVYKLKNGRFTQLGQSWLKHGYLSTNSPGQGCITPPLGGGQLGVNCLDTYGAGLNGNQLYLGPRSVVNPTTGYFPPVVNHAFATGDAIYKHAQTPASEIEASGGAAQYFGDGYYVTYDDATWNHAQNNASYTTLTFSTATAAPTVGTTVRRQPGIMAWGASDASVVTVNADHIYTLTNFGSQGDGNTAYPTLPIDLTCRYIVAGKVTDNGNGTWHYEYAVYNHNSDRSAYSFSMHLPAGAVTTGEGMYFPASHSGEPYSNTPWTADKTQAGMLTFKADNTFAGNPNANALRWGTMYTFWFDANVAPMSGQGRITLFKPAYTGTDASNAAAAPSGRTGNDEALWAFANGLQVPAYCTADIASPGGDLVPDGHTTVDDLIAYLTQFFAGNIAIADLATLGGGPGAAGDGQITVDDLVYFLAAFFSNCN